MKEGEVHLWYVRLEHPFAQRTRMEMLLSADERARAHRFLRDVHRFRFIACRGLLREVLGAYTGLAPDAVRFTYNPYGKPELANDTNRFKTAPIEFNLSHCDGIALFAIACGCPVGVDLQTVPEDDTFATHYFTAAERSIGNAAPVSERARTWTRLWTRKEAYLKATGRGFHGEGNDPMVLPSWEVRDWDWNAGDCSGVAALCVGGAESTTYDQGWWSSK